MQDAVNEMNKMGRVSSPPLCVDPNGELVLQVIV
jgi:hypothetical protein